MRNAHLELIKAESEVQDLCELFGEGLLSLQMLNGSVRWASEGLQKTAQSVLCKHRLQIWLFIQSFLCSNLSFQIHSQWMLLSSLKTSEAFYHAPPHTHFWPLIWFVNHKAYLHNVSKAQHCNICIWSPWLPAQQLSLYLPLTPLFCIFIIAAIYCKTLCDPVSVAWILENIGSRSWCKRGIWPWSLMHVSGYF